MKSNQLFFIAALLIVGAWAIKVYAGTIQMNTYYPAPNGYYDSLTIKNKLIVPCFKNSCTTHPAGLWVIEGADPAICPNDCPY